MRKRWASEAWLYKLRKSRESKPATHQNETVVWKLLRGSVEEPPEAPGKTRSTECKRVKAEPAVLPSG
ncbi:hypothetical protein M9458_047175, partial [Cirrhinus mrigala]